MTHQEIIAAIKEMTVLELNELVKAVEAEFGVSAVAAVASGPVAAEAAAEVEEQSEFDVILVNCGASKVGVIKVVRALTGLGLKEAKELVDGAPQPVKQGVDKEEAESIKKQLEEAGAAVELK